MAKFSILSENLSISEQGHMHPKMLEHFFQIRLASVQNQNTISIFPFLGPHSQPSIVALRLNSWWEWVRDKFFTLILEYLLPAICIDSLDNLKDFYGIIFFFVKVKSLEISLQRFHIIYKRRCEISTIRKRILYPGRLEPLTLRVVTYRSTNWAIMAIDIM